LFFYGYFAIIGNVFFQIQNTGKEGMLVGMDVKKTLNAVKKAEKEAGALVKQAKAESETIVEQARQDAEKMKAERIQKAKKQAAQDLKSAQDQGVIDLQEAMKKVNAEIDSLKQNVAGLEAQVVDKVIASLLPD
jgi:vacuolar-type H+-ATPase subunit H